MSSTIYRINSVLSRVVAGVPIGTNLGLFHLLWMLLSGRLLQSRGAVIPGLAAFGLPAAVVRRAWAALAYGRWHTARLLVACQQVVQDDGSWQAHRHGGYCPVACDLVGFWRPRLQACPTKHYCAQAGKALPAIPLGLTARVGSVGTQRLAIPCLFVRTEAEEPGEPALQRRLLQQTQALLAADEVLVTDRAFRSRSSTPQASRGMSGAARPTLQPGVPSCPRTVARAADRPQAPWSVRCHGPLRGARSRQPRPTGARPGRAAHGRRPASSGRVYDRCG
jgi:hypothetical protein